MKQFKLQQIATIVDGELYGNGEVLIINADIIRDATEGYLTFAETIDYFGQLKSCEASATLVPKKLVESFQQFSESSSEPTDFIAVDNVPEAFAKIVSLFRPPLPVRAARISEAAHIDPTARIGEGVTIDAGAVVGPGVQVGDDCHIHSGVQLMSGTQVGDQTEIFPNAVLYENTVVGDRCRLHANCVIGCYGFGYDSSQGNHLLCTQLGNVEIGDDVDIGAGTTIDRATYGSTTIGEGTKIDNQVQIGHNCRIGKRNLICSLVGIAGSCTTGDQVVMAGQVGIGDHISIGEKTILGAKAGVMADIPAEKVYVGIPATPAKQQMTIIASTHRLPEMRKKINQLEKDIQQLRQDDSESDSSNANEAA